MSTTINMPALPAPATDGTVRRWRKNEGDHIEKGEILVEIETERTVVEIESSRSATLKKILAPAGKTLKPGEPLAEIDEAAEPKAAPKAAKPKPQKTETPVSNTAVTPILMPKAGNDMEEGAVVKWLVSEGDAVKVGDLLFEIETDKATMEIESEHAGVIQRIVVPAGQTVAIHTPLAYIAASAEAVDALLAGSAPDSSGTGVPPVHPAQPEPGKQPAQNQPAAPANPVIPILMPKAGNDMEEGTVVKWRVAEGTTVKEGDVLFELETDKATMEIESEHAGTVRRIVVAEGQTVAIHTPLAYLAESDADVDAFIALSGEVPAPVAAASESKATPAPAAAASAPAPAVSRAAGERVKASPAARRVAAERGVDLASVAVGSGPEGRIISTDVPAAGTTKAPAAPAAPGEVIRRPLTPMRKAISRNLTLSVTTAPHFYMKLTVEAIRLLDVYKRQKKVCKASLNDLFILAIGRTMKDFPAFRSRIEGEVMAEYPSANIGVAVGTDTGLVVPVIMGVDTMSLADLAAESRRIIQLSREGKPPNMGKGNFTISNLGMYGVDFFTAIINPPESAILSIGAALETVKVENGAIKPTKVITVVLSSDHRIIDGLLAAKFMARLKEVLENPETMEG